VYVPGSSVHSDTSTVRRCPGSTDTSRDALVDPAVTVSVRVTGACPGLVTTTPTVRVSLARSCAGTERSVTAKPVRADAGVGVPSAGLSDPGTLANRTTLTSPART
jgi:hypothetical protein